VRCLSQHGKIEPSVLQSAAGTTGFFWLPSRLLVGYKYNDHHIRVPVHSTASYHVPVQDKVKVPMITKTQKAEKLPQIEVIDHHSQVPVQKRQHVPIVQTQQNRLGMPQVQVVDKKVEVPVQKYRCQ